MTGLYVFAILLNYTVNCILLLISAYYVSTKLPWQRIVIAAGIHCLLNHIFCFYSFFVSIGRFVTLIPAILCSFVAYLGRNNAIRGIGIYVLYQTVILLISLNVDKSGLMNLFFACICLYGIYKLTVLNNTDKDIVDVEIKYNDKFVKLRALRDTGNFLVDPLTGRSVILIGADAAKMLTGLDLKQISDPVSSISANVFPGLRLLPYKSIGKSNGMLLAYKFKDVKIGDEQGSRLVAFVPDGLTGDYDYQALTGGRL